MCALMFVGREGRPSPPGNHGLSTSIKGNGGPPGQAGNAGRDGPPGSDGRLVSYYHKNHILNEMYV